MTIGGTNPPAWVIAARRRLAQVTGRLEAAATRRVNPRSGIMVGLQNINRNVRSVFRK